MDHSKINSWLVTYVIALFLLTGALYIFVWSPSGSDPNLFRYQKAGNCPDHSNSSTSENVPVKDELDLVLRGASMQNKTVIIAVANKAYVEQSVDAETTMLDLFLESFWLGEDTRPLLDHLILVAIDQTAYDRCKFKRLHCYRLVTEGVDFAGEKLYMSEDFLKMMWRRTLFLLDVLKRGYNFIFTDTDIMWLRNPFAKLSSDQKTLDIQFSVDSYNGDSRPADHNIINTGFYYIRSNNKTISLFETLYAQKDNSTGKKEQDVLQELMRGGMFGQMEVQVRFLETRLFSGFCQDSQDMGAVITVHANCCRHIKAKFGDLTAVLRDWKHFKAAWAEHPESARNITMGFKWSDHRGCRNSWND